MSGAFNLAGLGWCALAGLASAMATYLIKMSHQGGDDWTVGRILWLGGAVATYALGFIFYSGALKRLNMSLAYPLMTATTMVLVTALGVVLLSETLSTTKVAGLALLAAGAFLVVR
jgi:small multidrug resistance pump